MSHLGILIWINVFLCAVAQKVDRCGPFFNMQGCPYNVDGTSGVVQYCSKWGFCGTDSTFKAQQTAGHYIYSSSLDGSVASTDVCTTRPDPGAFCNAIAASATCSLSDTRCELFNVQASDFDARGDYSKAVVRCGPFFGDYGCPVNADGLGTIQYCSKFGILESMFCFTVPYHATPGFCGTTAAFSQGEATGHYVLSRTLDGSVDPADVCTTSSTQDAFCASFLANSTCSQSETRCEIYNVKSSSFKKFVPGRYTMAPAMTAIPGKKLNAAGASQGSATDFSGTPSVRVFAVVFLSLVCCVLIAF